MRNQKPFTFTCLDKTEFINVSDGSLIEGADLAGKIQEVVSEQPGLTAMLGWEQTVSSSAAKTTNLLWTLCTEAAGSGNPDKMLQKTLGRLAVGAAGEGTGTEAPGRSVLEALVPLLADQIEAHDIDEAFWRSAVDVKNRGSGAPSEKLYSALHFERPTSYTPDSRGVVSPLAGLLADKDFATYFGYSQETLLIECGFSSKAKVEENGKEQTIVVPSEGALKDAKWFLVQINAACDEAQNHPGMLPYCLAVVLPDRRKTGKNSRDSVVATNSIDVDGTKCTMYLMGRFVIGLSSAQAQALKPVCRLRTALLDKLVFSLRTNAARLGTTDP